MKKLIILICVVLFLSGSVVFSSAQEDNTIVITGQIQRYMRSGGFYGINGDDGNIYRPENLSPGFQVENLRVKVEAIPVEKKFLFSSWYIPIQIKKIERGVPRQTEGG